MSAYNKQTWDTTSYVNPTRMNNMENGIANAACSESIAPVVTNPTTVAISSGSHFMLDGIRYRATTTISAGGTITPNTNCVAESVEEALTSSLYKVEFGTWTMTYSGSSINLTGIKLYINATRYCIYGAVLSGSNYGNSAFVYSSWNETIYKLN